MSASCSMEPDSRRSDICGFLSVRCSGPRLSWESAMTGTSSSLASSLSARENSETSCWRRLDPLARAHQLQVVDDDELEVVPLLEPAALGADLHQRHVRAVVDEQRRVGDLAHGARPGGSSRSSRIVPLRMCCSWIRGLGGQQAHRDLGAAHLEARRRRSPCLCLIAADRAMSSAQRRLADGGPGGDDDHLAGVQAVGERRRGR